MSNDIAIIKKLREVTGLSFDKIKKAMDEAGGDEAKALEVLKSYQGSMAAKKADREVKEGIVDSYIHTNKKIGAMVELLCETDFVARNNEFQDLARGIAMHATAMKPADAAETLTQPFVKDPSVTVQDMINQAIAKLGENIQLGRVDVFEI
jgi:elongation factor Ts